MNKKPRRVVLGEGYPSWDWTYSERSTRISSFQLVENGNSFKIPDKWRTLKSEQLPKIRLIAEVIE